MVHIRGSYHQVYRAVKERRRRFVFFFFFFHLRKYDDGAMGRTRRIINTDRVSLF